ncbi:MAG TPA: alanine--glyoxylate aminotransferase family protein [Candidatus Omnitrophica bacterium]|nr:alanine--glyoxylate aminotransferase family protein [Candidatus Omnitrophota bacterium]
MITPKKRYLLTPGPTPVPEEVLLSQAKPMIHHRTSEFRQILKQVMEDLKYVFQTQNQVLIFASSGTGAMEAAVVNLTADGVKFLPIVGGKFGERWKEICSSIGVDFIPLEVEWGKAVNPEDVEKILKSDKNIKVVLATLCETSTGVVNDIQKLAEITKKYDAILVVDAISGLLADEFKMDEWGVDVTVSGSQKGLMLPPGLAFISLSQRAWEIVEKVNVRAYYFDLKKARKSGAEYDTPYTPAVNLVIALSKALEMIKDEGIENIWKRHSQLATICRNAITSLGLKLFAQKPSNAVTSVALPSEIDGTKMIKFIREEFGVSIAGGQGKLKGKIFRIAHLGYMNIFDLLVGIASIEFALHHLGYKFELGKGLLKVEEEFLKQYK